LVRIHSVREGYLSVRPRNVYKSYVVFQGGPVFLGKWMGSDLVCDSRPRVGLEGLRRSMYIMLGCCNFSSKLTWIGGWYRRIWGTDALLGCLAWLGVLVYCG
jgi:hypothetical protein